MFSLFVKRLATGVGPFFGSRHNFKKIGRGPLGNATYQISRPSGFRQEGFTCFPCIKAYVKHVTPGVGQFLAPAA